MGDNENSPADKPLSVLSVPSKGADSAVPAPVESEGVSLSLVGPFYVTEFTGELPNGDKLTVNQAGVRVSAEDAAELVTQATVSGVVLRIGE